MAYVPVYQNRINWENEPSIVSPINATNLNKMDYALKAHDDTLATWDITKANESDLLLALKDVTYDTDTGEFVFTWWNGTTKTVDLNIEKIPVSFSMSPQGVITMTTDDGTTYTADVGALIKTYTFTDSSEIDFTVTTDASGNKTITASIVAGSIDGTKLTPNYLADCTAAKTGAETAEGKAEDSAEDAEAWAVGTRGGVPVPSTDPAYENNAEYWAHHTSSSLAGLTDTDINNPQNGQVPVYNSTTNKWENQNQSAGGGSTITVTTAESALYGQNVTITDGVTTLTETFSNSGEATFTGVTLTGTLTLASGGASRSISIPYFGNYSFILSLFTATVTVTYPAGASCTLSDGVTTLTGTGSPMAFSVPNAGTWTATVTLDGASKTDSAVITTDGQTASITIEYGTINVTYDNAFRGTSITCVQSGTTITKTAPSGANTMTFYPPTTGNWTISGTVSSDTYYSSPNPVVVSSLSTSVSATLETIPDGSTKTPTDDVSIWLSCAGIRDKAYTTLSEVLADSETFNALLGDSNACAYMARSTTFASTLCADQYAMSMIGQYDVCCDALLGNATWASAICASTYADYVFNGRGLVPTMTSNTAPSGVASASSIINSTYDAYRAFDGTSTNWASINNDGQGAYIQYQFTEPKIVKAVSANFIVGSSDAPYASSIDWILKASNNGTDFDDHILATSVKNGVNADIYTPVNNDTAYLYYRLVATSANYSQLSDAQVGRLQFYGATGSREYIHGTNNEVAYYLDGATQTPIVDPSTLSAGTYTFGSTVAKDPSDLTADYTKTIRITPNTKEIVLRPDNALYWWGYEGIDLEDLSTANGWNWNYTFTAPTHQTYGIIMQGFSDYGMQGVGGKTNYNVHSVKTICESVSAPSGYAQLALQTSKNISDGSATISAVDMVNGLSTITSDSLAYIRVESAGGNNTVTLKAFWYE